MDSEYAQMPLDFLELLSQIKDPRRAQGKKWQLGPVLLATILAILSGATSYRKVHGFTEGGRGANGLFRTVVGWRHVAFSHEGNACKSPSPRRTA